jgi:hypothetical protein
MSRVMGGSIASPDAKNILVRPRCRDELDGRPEFDPFENVLQQTLIRVVQHTVFCRSLVPRLHVRPFRFYALASAFRDHPSSVCQSCTTLTIAVGHCSILLVVNALVPVDDWKMVTNLMAGKKWYAGRFHR